MRIDDQKGFTLVELIIAMAIAAVLAWAAIFILMSGYNGWTRGRDLADLERDASVNVHTLHWKLRGMNQAQALSFLTTNAAALGVSGSVYNSSRREMKMTFVQTEPKSGVSITVSNLCIFLRNEP